MNLAIDIAKSAGNILLKYLGNLDSLDYKGSFNLVTNADKESEKYIVSNILKHRPDDNILAEEGNNKQSQKNNRLWMIDPIDGTTNYAHSYPFFAISIGLSIDDELTCAVVYNPVTRELFTAQKGCGAHLNGQKIKVSTISKLENSLLATGFSPDVKQNKTDNKVNFNRLTGLCHGVRRDGAASLDLAYVACGRLDGYWEYHLKPWDIAAGALLIIEAGGKVSDIEGHKFDFKNPDILVSNGLIHSQVLDELNQVKNLIV